MPSSRGAPFISRNLKSKTMKTSVLLLLWLLLCIAVHAQTTTCRSCCDAPDQPDLLPILVPELAEQCPGCTLVAVAQCRLTEADIAAQQSMLRYTLRLPDGSTSTHLAPMTLTPPSTGSGQAPGWDLRLFPPGESAPPCDPDAL
jgi:hypothetical protein